MEYLDNASEETRTPVHILKEHLGESIQRRRSRGKARAMQLELFLSPEVGVSLISIVLSVRH